MRLAIALLAVGFASCSHGSDPRYGRVVGPPDLTKQKAAQEKEAKSAARAAEISEAQRQDDAVKASIIAEAKEHGYLGVIFGLSLRDVLQDVENGDATLDQMKNVAIELREYDSTYRALQVIGETSALYSRSGDHLVVLLENAPAQIIERTPLTSLGVNYVVVVGTRQYKTVSGASRQAVVIRPAF